MVPHLGSFSTFSLGHELPMHFIDIDYIENKMKIDIKWKHTKNDIA